MIENLMINIIFLTNVFIWIFFIILFTMAIIFFTIFSYRYSDEPKKFGSISNLDNETSSSILKDLSENLRNEKKLKKYKSSIKDTIIMMFFQRIEDKKKLSKEKLVKLKKTNSKELYDIINNEEIYDFIQNFDEKNMNKDNFQKEINIILDKMERWD